MLITQGLRSFVRVREDLPALHAGYVVMVVLAAFLLNVGVFAALVATWAIFDVLQLRTSRAFRWGKALRRVGRAHLTDAAFLLAALASAVYMRRIEGVLGLSGLGLATMEIVTLLAVTFPKIHVLRRFLHRVSGYPEEGSRSPSRRLQPQERLVGFLCVVASLLLVASPWLLHADAVTLVRLFASQLVPWKI